MLLPQVAYQVCYCHPLVYFLMAKFCYLVILFYFPENEMKHEIIFSVYRDFFSPIFQIKIIKLGTSRPTTFPTYSVATFQEQFCKNVTAHLGQSPFNVNLYWSIGTTVDNSFIIFWGQIFFCKKKGKFSFFKCKFP